MSRVNDRHSMPALLKASPCLGIFHSKAVVEQSKYQVELSAAKTKLLAFSHSETEYDEYDKLELVGGIGSIPGNLPPPAYG